MGDARGDRREANRDTLLADLVQGLVAIHSSRGFDHECRAWCEVEPVRAALHEAGILAASMPRGAILAVAELVACEQIPDIPSWERLLPDEPERSFGFYAPGRWMWQLRGVRKLPHPVECRGMLGLWGLPEVVRAEVERQLPARGVRSSPHS